MAKFKQTGYMNLIFVVLTEDKRHLYFVNDEKKKKHPVQKKWGSAIRQMEAGVPYCVATSVTPATTSSGTSWNVLGVVAAIRNKDAAKELNDAYWSELAGNPNASTERKTAYAMEWATTLLNALPDSEVTQHNNTTWKLMKLFQDPSAFQDSHTTSTAKPNNFNQLFEF